MKKINEDLSSEIFKYYVKRIIVDDFDNIDDDIFKIAVYDPYDSKEHSYKTISTSLGDKLNVVVSGKHWVDVSNKGVNKGLSNSYKNIIKP